MKTPPFPRTLALSIESLLIFLFVLFLVRLGFCVYFWSGIGDETWQDWLLAFVYGSRFDLRVGLLFLIPFLLLAPWSWFSPWRGEWKALFWTGYGALVVGFVGLIQIIDFAHFAYLQTKLSAVTLLLLQDWDTAIEMMISSYPVFWLALLLVILMGLAVWWGRSRIQYWAPQSSTEPAGITGSVMSHHEKSRWQQVRYHLPWVLATTILVLGGLIGRISQYSLRWSDVHTRPGLSALIIAVSLNPIQNLYDTRRFRASLPFDTKRVETARARMNTWLGVSRGASSLSSGPWYVREVLPKPSALPGQPNVVLVFLESFAAYKTSLSGNPLGTTPFFDSLAREGIWFDHLFSPHGETARGVFAVLTGIPDVDTSDTSSRNPQAVKQYTIINSFKGYEKFYFIGGSLSWANIRGVLRSNIPDLRIYEEENYTSPRNNVWGISDTRLFGEAVKVFNQQQKPFIGIIQTSGNHRPYTIPAEDTDFQIKTLPQSVLEGNGFSSNEEYNAFRYMDYSISRFITNARQQAWFSNTVFAFFGDHGVPGNAGPQMPPAWTTLGISAVHTPLVLYAPKLLSPARYHLPGSSIDILPTVAGLMNRSYVNQTLGRDLLDTQWNDRRAAFFILDFGISPPMGILRPPWYLTQQGIKADAKPSLHRIDNATPAKDYATTDPQLTQELQQLLLDHYWTSRYMLINNAPVTSQREYQF